MYFLTHTHGVDDVHLVGTDAVVVFCGAKQKRFLEINMHEDNDACSHDISV